LIEPEDEDDPFLFSDEKQDDTVFHEIAREQREKKATKADDAEVPEYLWLEHLLEDADPAKNFDTAKWDAAHLAALPTLMKGLRHIGLKWWKKKVTLSFGNWLSKQFAAAKKPTIGPTVIWENDRYVWAGNKGKLDYLAWHLWRERSFEKDLKVGRDAIERTSKASWWTWDDGSTPLF
jgi:hypothetical protein